MTKYPKSFSSARSVSDIPASDRPRERIAREGSYSLRDEELIQIILGSGIPGHSVIDISKSVTEFLTSSAGDDINLENLAKIDGISTAKASSIIAALELGRRFPRKRNHVLDSPQEIYQLISHFAFSNVEHFIAIYLTGAYEVISINEITRGTLDRTLVHPREVLKFAIDYSAACIVVAHNHPSGKLQPSNDDLELTSRLSKACEIIGIPLIDHLIFNEETYISFRRDNLL